MAYQIYDFSPFSAGMYPQTNYTRQTTFNPQIVERTKEKKRNDNIKTALTIGGVILGIASLIYFCKTGKKPNTQAAKKVSEKASQITQANTANVTQKAEGVAKGASAKLETVDVDTVTEPATTQAAKNEKEGFFRKIKQWLKRESKNSKDATPNTSTSPQTPAPAQTKDAVSKTSATKPAPVQTPPTPINQNTQNIFDNISNAKNVNDVNVKNIQNLLNDTSIPQLPAQTEVANGIFRNNYSDMTSFTLFENGKEKISITFWDNNSGWITKGNKNIHFKDGAIKAFERTIQPSTQLEKFIDKTLNAQHPNYTEVTYKATDWAHYTSDGNKANGWFVENVVSGGKKLHKFKNGIEVAKIHNLPGENKYMSINGKNIISEKSVGYQSRQYIDLSPSSVFAKCLDKIKF